MMLVLICAVVTRTAAAQDVQVPWSIPGKWETVGRAVVVPGKDSVTIANGSVANFTSLDDCEMSFKARMPKDAEQVQIWGAIRVKDRLSRYVVGLRGGTEPQISLARYAPDANAKFLGFAPLDFNPIVGKWYTVRVAVAGKRFHVYVNDDKLPRINIEDKDAQWDAGGVAIGGGWLATEFADVKVTALTGDAKANFDAVGGQTWAPPVADKQQVRKTQRAAYVPVKVDQLPPVRGEISMNGNWLFMPDQDLPKSAVPTAIDVSDQTWHVIAVPSFWTPFLAWLHGEPAITDLAALSTAHGPSDKLVIDEMSRADVQTFDWKNTKSGWYREYLDLPPAVSGKQFNLVFDAIAKISEIYVNGTQVGANVGMFGQIDCDITHAVKPGRNVIAVHVIGTPEARVKDADKIEATAVTVSVTNEMLRSLPHGMAPANSSGIWQPVNLVITNQTRVGDLFIQPQLDGASGDIEIVNGDAQPHTVDVSYDIQDYKDHSTLDAGEIGKQIAVPANGKITAKLQTPKLQPKLWSPQTPNLYLLDIKLTEAGNVVDEKPTRFGFRTFAVKGSQFLLNGKPFWLRGADHFPATLRANDRALADRFIQLARDGNVLVTRTHAIPFTQTWLDAADEDGLGVSLEGTWPWLMIKGDPPSADLIKVWHDEFASLLKRDRNHPSILIWTVNNEMNFAGSDQGNLPLLKQKWAILDDMIHAMRQVDPTRPISAYSNYRRSGAQKGFQDVVVPNHFDDGDIDDAHAYYGWYGQSFFHLFDGQFGAQNSVPDRPLISQEMSTGYPRNDGWPSRTYEFDRYVSETLVGDYAYEQSDPAIFLARQALITKELAEVIRRTNRQNAAGILHFAYLTWFTDVWNADRIRPIVTYYELQKALQPVLVSAELFGRHFYAGDVSKYRVCIVNDDSEQQELPVGTLTWSVVDGEKILAQGTEPTPVVSYYSNHWLDLNIQMPATLPTPRVNVKLRFTLTCDGKIRSTNDYDIVVASREWAAIAASDEIQLFDPSGSSKAITAGLNTKSVTSLDTLSVLQSLIVGDFSAVLKSKSGDKLKDFVNTGGRVLLLQPKADLMKLFPDFIKSYRSTEGEIVTMQLPESPVFDGIEPLDTAWFEMGDRHVPLACDGTFEVDRTHHEISTLAMQCDPHGDMKNGGYSKVAGAPLIEIRLGRGVILASEMMLSSKDKDPIAGRLLANMISYLRSHDN